MVHGMYKHCLQHDILLTVPSYLVRVEYRGITDGMLHSDVKAHSQLPVALLAGLSKGKLGTPNCRGMHFPALASKPQWSLGRLKC